MPQIQILPAAPGGFGTQLGQALGQGFNQGISANLNQMLQAKSNRKRADSLQRDLIERGYPEELASLAAQATTGGQTEVLKTVLDQLKRSGQPQESFQEQGGQEISQSPEGDVGLTPRERVMRQSERFKTQFPKYEELSTKARGYEQEGLRLGRLSELNNSEKLPSGLGRLNVNLKSGELVAPFASNPETQEFVKIVNDFLSGAKESFGARVTNFEVDRFLKRLPSLLNTKEGRDAVLHQMQVLNDLNKMETQGVLDVIDQAGGIRNIDLDRAKTFVKRQNKDAIEGLKKSYLEGVREEQKENQLTEDLARDILKQANGDKEKARKIARKKGFSF